MNWHYYEWILLALLMWREARGQGRNGMRAVGHVAWNRHMESRRPLHHVITDDAQFTSINPYKKTYDPQLDVWPRQPDSDFNLAMLLAEQIANGEDKDLTGGATFYWNPQASETGGWFDRTIASKDTPLEPRTGYRVSARLGAHIFYAAFTPPNRPV